MKTLKDEIKLSGLGLHSGEKSSVRLVPSDRAGIYFGNKQGLSSVTEAIVEEDQRLTGFFLPNGATVRTAEHLLAAIAAMGLEAVEVYAEGEEIPIMDGSAFPFAEAIRETGLAEVGGEVKRRAITVPIVVEEKDGRRFLSASPSEQLTVSYVIDYSGTPVGTQNVTYKVTAETFYNIISKARTFGLTAELDYLKRNGLAKGGSLENALVFDEEGLVGGGSLRFPLECVTHKVIDLLGDLTLSGPIPTAHYVGIAAGHSIHGKLARKIKSIFP
ncbi:MAG: UDP-3-O-acyl-N-acetylglucosamine deacetylase [Synergistaceae bacterium]|nr:UDP-3-O-acyl-N-acetylglucosamine deacetylase [Synergistaceae bacterium]